MGKSVLTSPAIMIDVRDLHKSYGHIVALAGVSCSVNDAEIFGIIGPDGAGKTSLFRILASLLLPDSGSALMNGVDVVKDYEKIHRMIGYMPGKFSLYQDLTVEENLYLFATVFNTTIEENYHLVKDIYQQIEPFKTRRAGRLSGGMKQKLALCCALIHKPEVLLLDEPTTGVDPVSRKEFWDMLRQLKKQGITILVSTAYMDEASLCDRIALIQKGRFLGIDTPQGIISSYRRSLWSLHAGNVRGLLKSIRSYPHVRSCFAFGESHHVAVEEGFSERDFQQYLSSKGYGQIHLEPISPTVEDFFLDMTIDN